MMCNAKVVWCALKLRVVQCTLLFALHTVAAPAVCAVQPKRHDNSLPSRLTKNKHNTKVTLSSLNA